MNALIFDIETIPNVPLLKKLYPAYWGARETDTDAVKHLEFEEFYKLDGTRGMIPATMQVPVSIVATAVHGGVIKNTSICPSAAALFEMWDVHCQPTFVSYNGRCFDMPILEQQLLTDANPVPDWFNDAGPAYKHLRHRFNTAGHYDCMEFQTAFGAGRANGGMDLQCKLIGAPGKLDTDGSQVWDLHQGGKTEEIHNYCKQDVLNTYLLWMRQSLIAGKCDIRTYARGLNHLKGGLDKHTEQWAKDFNAACDWDQLLGDFNQPTAEEVPA